MAAPPASDLDVGEPIEREGHETLLPSVERSVLSTKSFVASELETPSALGSQVEVTDDAPAISEVQERRGARPGDVIGGRYVVEGQLGRGGMGLVLRVRHSALGKAFALKVIKSAIATSTK